MSAATKVTPPGSPGPPTCPGGVVKWASRERSLLSSALPQLIDTTTTPGWRRA